MTAFSYRGADLLLRLYVQPKASRDQIIGLHGDAIKVAITAPPIEGKANAHIQKMLATLFAVSRSQIELVKGDLSRHKQVLVKAPFQLPPELAFLLIQEHQ